MAAHLETGWLGEQKAAEYLQSKGYVILEKNWRCNHKEIDIIATHNNNLVFVEVKSQTNCIFKKPEESVTPQKQKHLIEAVQFYLENNDIDMNIRFDVISVIIDKDKCVSIEHFEEAFFPEIEPL